MHQLEEGTMVSLARFSIRRPKLALATWLVVGVVLALIGLNVSNSLSPSVTVVPGTQSARAEQLANAHFGPSQLVPILLEGPRAQLNRQGPALVRALDRRAHTRVLSAWDGGTVSAQLRRSATAAMIIVSIDRSERNAVRYDQPQIESLVSRTVRTPVKSYVTGQPSIDRAINSASLDNLKQTELIAIGILFVLLLIGLRAPVAALVVSAVAALSTLAAFGEVAVLGHVMTVSAVAAALGSMTGLILGVGFALAILDRFRREERTHHLNAVEASIAELKTTSRAVLVGGTAIALALALVALIGPTELMVSLGTGMLTCALFAIGGAVVVLPAALVLLGNRIYAFSFPAPAPLERAWSRLVDGGNWVTRHAVWTGFFATLVLAAIAVPAFGLTTGPQTITQLPKDTKARVAFEEVNRVMGPGMATPYDVVVVAHNRPITSPKVLAAIRNFQLQIVHNKSVASVTGPGALASTSSQLAQFEPSLNHSVKVSDKSKKDLLKLIAGLGLAGNGSQQLQSGLAAASQGAGLLNGGSGQAQNGAGLLHAGLGQALAGAQALYAGDQQALSGAEQLANGLGAAPGQASQSVAALRALSSLTGHTSAAATQAKNQAGPAAAQVTAALNELQSMTSGKQDPHYAAAVNSLQSAASAVGGLNSSVQTTAGYAAQTDASTGLLVKQAPAMVTQLQRAATGASQLASGIQKLRNGNGQLSTGLGQLTSGAGQLENGLGQITNGTAKLAAGLSGGVGPAGQLTSGLGQMQAAVITARGQIPSTAALKQLEKQSPGLFSSGYFVLAAVAGAPTTQLIDSTFTINTLRGGTAGQIVVTSKYPFTDPRSIALAPWLVNAANRFAKANNLQIAVGGPAGNTGDLTNVTKDRVWLDVAVLAAAMVLLLMVALRAVVLPIVATAFSLLVAGSTFGVLQLLFGGSNPPLGGPGWLDPMTLIGIFTIAFSVTVAYAALLLMRTREAVLVEGPGLHAVRTGLRDTAAAATGAGIVMVAALIPFSTTSFINVREFGIGVAVAVLLNILILRPVLLPAAEAVLGRFGWWPTATRGAGRSDETKTRRRPHLPSLRQRGVVHS
jgi:putative drug exporter of the RND superfamily